MKKKHCITAGTALMLSAACNIAQAQDRTITGTVTDGAQPLSGVAVQQAGYPTATITSEKGNYTLRLTGADPILIFRHPEYGEKRISAGKSQVINITLSAKINSIEEVVLNAGYYQVKAKENTGSIAKVSSKELENQPVSNVLSALQGRMAGVSIIQNSGIAGGGFDVQIRGKNSLRTYDVSGYDGNTPLYIIDGVPVPSLNEYKSGLSNAVLPYGDTNPLSSLNPADIESIDILKDADATAIYGSKGANGVVLVTTKKGVKGKTQVKLSTSWGAGQVANLPKMMSKEEYLQMRRTAFANDGVTTYPANAYDVNGRWDENRETDWQKYFTGHTAELLNAQLGISGGSKNTSVSLSGGHSEESTVFPGNYRYKKNNVSVHLDHTSTDGKLKAAFAGYYALQDNVLPPTDFNFTYATLTPNAPPLYGPDGKLNWENNTFTNPMAAASQTYDTTSRSLTANTHIRYLPGKGFSLNLNAGYGSHDTYERRILPKTFFNPSSHIGSERSELRKVSMANTNWLLEPQLEYNMQRDSHEISVLLGASFQEQQSDNETLYGFNFPSDELIYDLSSANTLMIENSFRFLYRYQALYSRLNYSFRQKYTLNLTGRRDGSSRFGKGRRFGNFGAAGAAWLFSKEGFLKDVKWLSFGKLRASYGITGNDQIGDYQFYDTYYTTGTSYDGYPSIVPARLYNDDFGWESTKKLETATELSLFKERLFISAAWYRNVSDHQLTGLPLPGTTGFSSVQSNLPAAVLNSGTEFVIQAKIIEGQKLSWSSSFNITFPRNKLLRFPGLEGSSYKSFYEIGKSTSLKKLYHYTGIDRATGMYTFEDTNGDGILNSQDKTVVKELTQHWYGGFQNTLQYRNWTLNILLQLSRQNTINMFSGAGKLGAMGNKAAAYLDYWTPENTDATFQKPSAGYNSAASSASSMFTQSDAIISDTFTLRVKNIAITYDLPTNKGNRLNARIFLQGQNLMTFSNYKGLDPEFNLPGFISPLRVVSMGINLTY